MSRFDFETQSWTNAPPDYGKQVPVRFNRKTELPLLDALVARAKKRETYDNKATRSSVILKLVLAAAKGLKPVVVEEKKAAVDDRQREAFPELVTETRALRVDLKKLRAKKKKRAPAARKTKRGRGSKKKAKAKKAGKK